MTRSNAIPLLTGALLLLMALPVAYYDVCIEMLNEDDARQRAANERAKMRARMRR